MEAIVVCLVGTLTRIPPATNIPSMLIAPLVQNEQRPVHVVFTSQRSQDYTGWWGHRFRGLQKAIGHDEKAWTDRLQVGASAVRIIRRATSLFRHRAPPGWSPRVAPRFHSHAPLHAHAMCGPPQTNVTSAMKDAGAEEVHWDVYDAPKTEDAMPCDDAKSELKPNFAASREVRPRHLSCPIGHASLACRTPLSLAAESRFVVVSLGGRREASPAARDG